MTPEQSAAAAHLSHVYAAQKADNDLANARYPGLDDPEFDAASARFLARLADKGEIDEGWREVYRVFDNAPPKHVVDAIEAHFWQPSTAELDEFDPVLSPFDGRKGEAAA